MSNTQQQAIAAIKTGDKETGKRLLTQALQEDPKNETAWLWLASVTSSNEEQVACLNRVLDLNPKNKSAQRGLAALLASTPQHPLGENDTPSAVDVPSKETAPPPATHTFGQSKTNLIAPPPVSAFPAATVAQTVTLDKAEMAETHVDDTPPATPTANKTGTYDIFISYSRKDKPFVQTLFDTLQSQGKTAWVDWGNIPLTADWRREIREGIERSNAVVFVMSPNFLASKETLAELTQAEEYSKRLIPFVYQDVNPAEVPQSLAALNWIFARASDDYKTATQTLIEAMDTDLEWVKMHTRLLVKATEWHTQERNYSFLLYGQDLIHAETLVAGADKNPAPTPLQKQYILASRQNAVSRQRLNFIRMSMAFAITLVLVVIAIVQFRRANSAQILAEEKQVKAEHEARIALSRQLLAQAVIYADEFPDLAALLSLKVQDLDPDINRFGNTLLASLRHSPYLVTSLHGHSANVQSVDFSPDGQTLASGSKDNTIILWNIAAEKPIGPPLTGHTDRVTTVAYHPNEQTLASGSRDGTIRLWDTATQQPVGEPLIGHNGWVNNIAYNPSGQILASAGRDGTIILWDTATRQPLGNPLAGHARAVNSVVFHPTGTMMASAGDDNAIILWDVAKGQPLSQPLTGHIGRINDLAFSPDGQTLASASADRTIRLWNVATGIQRRTPLTGHPTSVTTVAFSPDGRRLISGSEDDSVIIWDVKTGQQLGWPLVAHANSVLDVAFNPNGKFFVSASSDGTIGVWNIIAGQFFVGHTSVVRSVDFSPDGHTIASGSSDDTVRLWQVDDPTESQVLFYEDADPDARNVDHADTVWSVAFSPDGQRLVVGDQDGKVILWDVSAGTNITASADTFVVPNRPIFSPLLGHEGGVLAVTFSPDGRYIASAGEDKKIIIWDSNTGVAMATLQGHQEAVNTVKFNPTGITLASGSNDNTIILWDVATGQPLGPPLHHHTDDVNSVDFNPDGTMLASGSSDNAIVLWQVSTGQVIATLQGHTNRVTSVAFSPTGQTLASGSYDRNIILWDVASQQPIGPPLIGHTNDVNSIAWSPDGQALVSGSWDDTLILWTVDLTLWPQRACQIANRNLTQNEWTQFIGDSYPFHNLCPE